MKTFLATIAAAFFFLVLGAQAATKCGMIDLGVYGDVIVRHRQQ